jgi:hypothetical protein
MDINPGLRHVWSCVTFLLNFCHTKPLKSLLKKVSRTSIMRGKKIRVIYTTRIHWVERGTRTPKDRDEVNRREVSECDG